MPPAVPDTVLLVDDEPLVLLQLAKIIRELTPVRTASGCNQAREVLAQVPQSLLALVVDLHLSDGMAWDVLAYAHQRTPGIPAMILTGRADHTVPGRALLAGATYLEKPFDSNALRRFVTDAMARALGREAEVHRVVSELTARFRLTPTERAIIEGRIIGLPKGRLRDGRNLVQNTANTHHAHIRQKTGMGIPELIERALREIFGVTL